MASSPSVRAKPDQPSVPSADDLANQPGARHRSPFRPLVNTCPTRARYNARLVVPILPRIRPSRGIPSMTANRIRRATLSILMVLAAGSGLDAADPPGVVTSEFIYDADPPTPSCHASTIVEARRGFLAAWFGGTDEGEPDVAIYLARREGGKWSKPAKVIDGIQDDGRRFPCWNPVLSRPKDGPILLFAKVGPSPSKWWGVLTTSDDDGLTWSKPQRLPEGILGPIKNKPITLPDG